MGVRAESQSERLEKKRKETRAERNENQPIVKVVQPYSTGYHSITVVAGSEQPYGTDLYCSLIDVAEPH